METKIAPYGTDGDVFSRDYVTGAVVLFARWSTYGNAFGAVETAIAYYGTSLVSSDVVAAQLKRARRNVKEYLMDRGEIAPGDGYRAKLVWRVMHEKPAGASRMVQIWRFWEAD